MTCFYNVMRTRELADVDVEAVVQEAKTPNTLQNTTRHHKAQYNNAWRIIVLPFIGFLFLLILTMFALYDIADLLKAKRRKK